LERLRFEHARELERLRAEVDALLSGAIRLQEKEFKVLPEAWALLHSARQHIRSVVSPAQQYVDVDRMNDSELKEFLERTVFTDSQKNSILTASKKMDAYINLYTGYAINDAIRRFGKFNRYIDRNSIFLPPDIANMFEGASKLLWSAVIDKRVGHEIDDFKMQSDAWRNLERDFSPLYEQIMKAIKKRLHEHGRPTP
jgi:hypothetical protein